MAGAGRPDLCGGGAAADPGQRLGRDARAQQTALLEDALQQAVVSCYATEGRYPADLEYLIEHYGVQLDREQYLVVYDIFADNIRPRVRVVWMGED